ncbi:MAG TPA: hypothetical protein VFQ42_04275 [Mycobacterium sp.]|nr:hypothetical protein [Mycobacterium sp.]
MHTTMITTPAPSETLETIVALADRPAEQADAAVALIDRRLASTTSPKIRDILLGMRSRWSFAADMHREANR